MSVHSHLHDFGWSAFFESHFQTYAAQGYRAGRVAQDERDVRLARPVGPGEDLGERVPVLHRGGGERRFAIDHEGRPGDVALGQQVG